MLEVEKTTDVLAPPSSQMRARELTQFGFFAKKQTNNALTPEQQQQLHSIAVNLEAGKSEIKEQMPEETKNLLADCANLGR